MLARLAGVDCCRDVSDVDAVADYCVWSMVIETFIHAMVTLWVKMRQRPNGAGCETCR